MQNRDRLIHVNTLGEPLNSSMSFGHLLCARYPLAPPRTILSKYFGEPLELLDTRVS